MTTKSGDWVFSNTVIEHIGPYEYEGLFANDIRRVAAKGIFVACPNKCFPVEPHTLLFYQFLAKFVQEDCFALSGILREI